MMELPYNLSTKRIEVIPMPCFYRPRTEQPHLPVIEYCLKNIKDLEGLYLEFGVWSGISTNFIADIINPHVLHAFDSFEGLHTEWNGLDENFFAVDFTKLKFFTNVRIHKGYFSNTIPDLYNFSENISFINIDCDIYSSTCDILFGLNSKIVPGTIIYFDELYNYLTYLEHEYKALVEWTEENDRECKTIAFNDSMGVAIEVTK